MNKDKNTPIILFDGVCKFCSASVEFVIKRNSKSNIIFCQIQSESGQKLLHEYNLQNMGLNSMVLIYHDKAYIKSSAALRIATLIDKPWPLMAIFLIVPVFIRHAVYDFIGKHRYTWFGKRDKCWVPDEKNRERFLS